MIQDLSKTTKEYDKANNKLRIAIVKSNFYKDLTDSLEKSCREYLVESGILINKIKTFNVPGSWEIPLITKKIAASKKYDGIVTFGVILKGETYHFEAIAKESSRALMDIVLEFNIPVTFEILAVYDLEQAKKRSIGKYNKGIEAAKTVLEMIKELSKI